jgi:hypothetical protein
MTTIPYTKDLIIRNVESLPVGGGCKYLICIKGENGELVAKQWRRVPPKKIENSEVLVKF